jgi:hypothetical protein
MSDSGPIDKTRAALKNLEPWADDEISRLEKTFAAQGRSDDLAAKESSVLGVLKKGSFVPGFVLGLILGLAISTLIILL